MQLFIEWFFVIEIHNPLFSKKSNMQIADIIAALNQWAPPAYQESYDNSRLLTGDINNELTGVLITLDCIEDIVDEAIASNCNLIVAHHPIIFGGLKSLTGKNYVERTVIKAIKHDIAIFSIHTNLDNVRTGVNKKICDKLGLIHTKILAPKSGVLSKLVTFIPEEHAQNVIDKMHEVGAGQIGNYDQCSFQIKGTGTFRPNEDSRPLIGQPNTKEFVNEVRVEILFPTHLKSKLVAKLQQAHPYEEVAYYAQELSNENVEVGSGMIGELNEEMTISEFFSFLKKEFDLSVIRHTTAHKEKVKRIAVCGGSGSFFARPGQSSWSRCFHYS